VAAASAKDSNDVPVTPVSSDKFIPPNQDDMFPEGPITLGGAPLGHM
jgi:hypothetical protein